MADSILRLKVDSQEYDAKLKRAAQGLQQYADGCRKMGGTLEVVEQDTLDFVKAVGQMETVSNTAKGKLNELTHAFTELSVQYKQLTDAEKQSPFGQALASSLDQLKGRIQDSKNQLDDVTKTLSGSGGLTGALDSLAGKFGLNIKQLTGFGAVLGASKLALDAAKDAFFSSETNVDDWGRTVAESEAIYESFVQALNTGNFSGFLTNIGQVTQAAKDAYNALDELGTRMTIINPERAKLQAEQQRLRATIRREGANSEAGKQATAQLRALEPKLAKSYTTESKMNYNAFEKLVRERLAVGGINLNQKSFDQFMKTFSSDAAFNRLKANARGKVTTEYTSGGRNEEGQVSRVDTRNTEQKLLDLFTDKWRQQNSGYLTAAFNAQGASFTNQLGNSRYLRTQGDGGGGRTGGTTTHTETPQEKAQKRMSDAQHKYTVALEKAQAEFDGGNITEKDLKTAQKRAAESLFEAADDAYRTYADPQYKTVREDAKQKFVNLGGEIKTLTETEKANQKAAREQEQAQKKLSDALRKQADALERGNLKDYNAATKQVREAEKEVARLGGSAAFENVEHGDINIPVGLKFDDSALKSFTEQVDQKLGTSPIPFQFALNQENVAAVIENLKEQLSRADVGSELFNSLLEKLGNAQLISDSINKGISDNIDGKTGKKRKKDGDSPMDKASKALGGLNSIAGGLEKMGVELPSEVQNLIGVIEGAMAIIQGVQAIIAITQTTALTANTVALGALTAAMWANVTTNWIPFMKTGGIAHAAQGFVPGNNYSDNVPLMVSSGELILNRAQQGNLASQLEGGAGLGELNLSAVIRGEQIRLVLNNNGRRTGRGEYVQSKSVK